MFTLIKNAKLYSPAPLGMKDILIAGEKIAQIEDSISISGVPVETIDAKGKIVTPGLIDQHIHLIGAGGKYSFQSMTPEIMLGELIRVGTTTVMGLLGTDGSARSLKTLYAKCKALEQEGISTYMLTSYFNVPPLTFMETVQDDMVFIDKVIGCKIAVSEERGSFPTPNEFLKILKQVRVGGMISGKGGVLHIHLGKLSTGLQPIIELVTKYEFPIENISPTHCIRTKELFEESLEFARLGGMIDITSGGTQYTAPHQAVLYALEQGIPMERMTFSSDGNAGIGITNDQGELIGFKKAPIHRNLEEVVHLIQTGKVEIGDALKLITSNPAQNLKLPHKGRIAEGMDADLCFFNEYFGLLDVFARGQHMMKNGELLKKGNFELL